MVDVRTENRVDVLRQAAVLLDHENQRLHKRLATLLRENAELKNQTPEQLEHELLSLKHLLAQREQALFGTSSERRESARPNEGKRKERDVHGPTPQLNLKVVEHVYDLDEPDQQCPKCGGVLKEITGQFEESEEIDVVERCFVVRKHKRKKYRCQCNACVETALGPIKLRPGNRYSIDFAIDVAISKYSDHLPLYRQAEIMAREGLVVTTQTLFEQLHALMKHLKPTIDALHAHILTQDVICADETRWPMLNGKGEERPASTKWHAWSVCCPHAVTYQIHDNRSSKAASEILSDYSGVVVADGYGVYGSHAKKKGRYTLAHCWVHTRRKFVQAEAFFPQASEAIALIGKLYKIEDKATGPPNGSQRLQHLAELRATKSKAVVQEIQAWVLEQRVLPKSAIGKAISYMQKVWPGLMRFLEDPKIPLDTNAVERSIRGLVVGRKNHFGSKSQRGTDVAAAFYSLIESAKLCDVEPRAYLKAVTLAAINGEAVTLPHEFGASHEALS